VSIVSPATSGAHSASGSLLSILKRYLEALAARMHSAVQDWRFCEKLAGLSDRSLLDIGIAEDEIPRVRAMERFKPRAWVDKTGSSRCCDI
jgi:uncharacterized protein YjiS (DUF1127 family)